MNEKPRYQLYGRRVGRPLRRSAERLLETKLPTFEIEILDTVRLHPARLFPSALSEFWLEIGFGSGEHLVALAEPLQHIGFLGCEPFRNGVAKLLASIAEKNLENIRIFADDARLLIENIESKSLQRVFVLFPDPWPKARHAKRRIINPATIDELHRILKPGGEVRIATDFHGLVRWIMIQFVQHGGFEWLAASPEDWRKRTVEWPSTRYEAKALKRGHMPTYLRFRRLGLE